MQLFGRDLQPEAGHLRTTAVAIRGHDLGRLGPWRGPARAEEFRFALAVVQTPAMNVKEDWRLYTATATAAVGVSHGLGLWAQVMPGLAGMVFSFAAGRLALRWLSRWLEQDRRYVFGFYCLAAAPVVFVVS